MMFTSRRRANSTTAPGDSVVLAARDLTSGYGDLAAVREVTLDAEAGKVTSLLGPNGAGKSTLLLTLVGEIVPMNGTVSWLGRVKPEPQYRRARQGLAFVPEGRPIVSRLSVADNLKLGKGGIDPAIAIFPELSPLLSRQAGLLSGGEQQMVALGRALAAEPRALLVDELSLGLSPAVTTRLLLAIRRAADDQGVAVILVEQQIARAFDVCDSWIVMKQGGVIATGTHQATTIRDVEAAYMGDE